MSVIKPALQHPELIAYFSGANNYCWLVFRNGEKRLLSKPISYLEAQLPNFIRVHKTILVNPACVERLHEPPQKKKAGEIQLNSGEVFPVSRRRWSQVLASMEHYQSMANYTSDVSLIPKVQQMDSTQPFILLITDDEKSIMLTRQIIEKRWPTFQLDTAQKSTHLVDILRNLPRLNHPALLLLDARKTTQEQFVTLQHLKEDPNLCQIPIILIVSPSIQYVIEGYNRKANSVFSVSEEPGSFTNAIDRICHFWLQMVTLPIPN